MRPSARCLVPARHRAVARSDRTDPITKSARPSGIAEVDSRLPGGALALGARHQVAGGGGDTIDSAATALFSAGVAARTKSKILW